MSVVNPSDQQLNTLLKHFENKRLSEAKKLATSITQEFPKHPFAWKALGAICTSTGKISEAVNAEQTAVTLSPKDPEAHYNLGITLKELGKLEEAKSKFIKAIELKPDHVEAYNNLGTLLLGLGRFEEAKSCFIKTIELKPNIIELHLNLTKIKKFNTRDKQYFMMQKLSLDKNISEEQLSKINFSLGKACDDLKDFGQAFKHYKKGNMLCKKLLNYNINQDIELFKQLESNYINLKKNSLKIFNPTNKPIPIFIVGMPRSGTTLTEQIISSHSQVAAGGELPFISQFGKEIARGLSKPNNDNLLNFRNKYLAKLQNISHDKLIVTDKMPQNFRYIGLLAAAFPEAKIVHVRRNPAAVCWGNYKEYFTSKNIGYCYELDDIVSYYKLYKNLMEFWELSLEKKIYLFNYEKLTIDQEYETRKLIDYLDLDWDEKCLSPENNMRNISTASSMQVRKKVYKNSSQEWKKYEQFLNNKLDLLDN